MVKKMAAILDETAKELGLDGNKYDALRGDEIVHRIMTIAKLGEVDFSATKAYALGPVRSPI